MIKKRNGKFLLFTSDGHRVLGVHPTLEKAKAQESAVSISKARAAGHNIPVPVQAHERRIPRRNK